MGIGGAHVPPLRVVGGARRLDRPRRELRRRLNRVADLERVPGTEEVHDLHVWSLTTGRYALSAHAVVTGDHDHDADDAILAAMADLCARDFHIDHVTIQLEHESRRAAEPVH